MEQEEKTHFGYQVIPAAQKTTRVGEVFNSVAKRYDLMNNLMSFGLHHVWKKLAVARTGIQPHHTVLDLAGGTGDLTALFLKKLGNQGQVILADINEAMLTVARQRLIDLGHCQRVRFLQANAEWLPFPNHYFHSIVMAFGLRNVTHKEQALLEMLRVLKPTGRLVLLEFSHLQNEIFRPLYDAYSFSILPVLGKLICGDANSYQYLAESIRVHPNQMALKTMMTEAGFKNVEYQNIHGGIVALHIGTKL